MTRRELFLTTAFAASVEQPGTTSDQSTKPLIRSARLGAPTKLAGSGGDTWIAAWADDDTLYVTSDDTSGFDNACGKSASNLAVNRVSGSMPPQLRGETVNCMKEYGLGSETKREDGGMWKACGITCVDGILYMGVSRQLTCPTEPNFTWGGAIAHSRFRKPGTRASSALPITERLGVACQGLVAQCFPGGLSAPRFSFNTGKMTSGKMTPTCMSTPSRTMEPGTTGIG